MPSLDILAKIARINHDGFGFVSSKHHFKAMNYDRFLDHLAKVRTCEECIIHMRFATHGSKCRANCHPFSENSVYFAHNGVLDIKPYNDMTDSETAFRSLIYPAIERYGFDSKETKAVIFELIGYSRFALMYKGQVRLFGDFSKLNNIYYSNLRWL